MATSARWTKIRQPLGEVITKHLSPNRQTRAGLAWLTASAHVLMSRAQLTAAEVSPFFHIRM